MAKWQGWKWIRVDKRLAIYLRDGMTCCYCGQGIADGVQLHLDHLTPRSQGGGNEATNLVTACARCNTSRGDRPVRDFAEAVAAYLNRGVTADKIMAHINKTRNRKLSEYRTMAKAILANAPDWAMALEQAAE